MKSIKLVIFWISLILIISCQDAITPNKPDTSKLVLFAYIIPGEQIIASVTKSIYSFENNRELALVDSVLVTLFKNDVLIDTFDQTDSVLFVSNHKSLAGNKYKIQVKDLSTRYPTLISNEVFVLEKPEITKITLDSIGQTAHGLSSQDNLRLTVSFEIITGYKYMAYTTGAFEQSDRQQGHRWETNTEYRCTEDELIDILDVSLANIGCFSKMQKIVFERDNYDLQKLDSIKIKLCKIPNFTGDFMYNSKLSRTLGNPYLSALAPDDNITSNVSGGYGAVLTISCTEEIYKIK